MQNSHIVIPSKPNKIQETKTKGVYEITGLYPGYGYTLGNCLRRMLLSSTTGAAITEIRIKGVQHEFSTITGVKEDVLTTVLRIKRLRVSVLSGVGPFTCTIKKKGKGIVTGKDIECPSEVRVVNQDEIIAEITDAQTSLEIELVVETGIGFRSRDEKIQKTGGVGVIHVDALFSPVLLCSYTVENDRVGNRTDFNKLTITIETDGTVSPQDAFSHAIRSLIIQFESILGFKIQEENDKEQNMLSEIKNKTLGEVGFSPSVIQILSKSKINTVKELVSAGADKVSNLSGVGDKTFQDIVDTLARYGIVFKKS
ncbi:MAG: DNA-directed RNA polymerase subunit alpha [Alphaproteobacteria bacterium]|nr:DNA-directed RNA polymerase subunit alpha [Alphaproteobacteria bacterium]